MSAILFDMDGTLVDSEPLWLEAEREVMESVGSSWSAQDQLSCLGGPRERTEKIMQEKSNNVKPYGFFGDQLDILMLKKLEKQLQIVPNAIDLINQCRSFGLKIALVTASGGTLMRTVLIHFPDDYFDITISADDVAKSKPDPEPYLLAADRLNVRIEDCLVVEDSITGVTSGLNSGAQVIGIPHLVSMPEHQNLRIVKSLAELSVSKLINWYPFLNKVKGINHG
jgi:HAD superfamily hydrolase (TIGR01509 family)